MLLRNIKSIAAASFAALCMLCTVSFAQAEENKIPAELNSPFAQGESNTAYAKYFIGSSYLNMLVKEGVTIANVTFEPACRKTGISIKPQRAADKFCLSQQDEAGIRNGAKKHSHSKPVMLWLSQPA